MAFSGKKRGFYPVENFVDFKRFFGSFPRVFQGSSPQTVGNSVDSSVKKREKPRKSRGFSGFAWIKSIFGAVDKCRLVLFFVENNFPQRKSKNLWKSHKMTNQRHKKERTDKAVLFGRVWVFYNVQINRSITPYPSAAERFRARSAVWQAVTAPRRRARSVLRACLR